METFRVTSMIHDVVTTITPLVGKNANTFVVQCVDELGVMLGDLTKVRQSLFNSHRNVCKFSEDRTIRLSVRREGEADGEWITKARVRMVTAVKGEAEWHLARVVRSAAIVQAILMPSIDGGAV